MDKTPDLFTKILKNHNLYITESRLAVFNELFKKSPQSMHDLGAALTSQIDRASIYRSITLFEKLGIVQRVNIGWKYKLELTDIFRHSHHYATCLKCGRLVTLKDDGALEQAIANLAQKYKILEPRHNFEMQGYCQKCSRRITGHN